MKFTCKYSGRIWYHTNIYGPAHNEERMDFISWLAERNSSDMHLWMIMGDFNLIRGPENRSRSGGDSNNMMNFNAIIQAHDLEEIPLKGREFTWSNMQDSPLLERLDWVFTSPGFSHLLNGLLNSLILCLSPWPDLALIISLFMSRLATISPSQLFSDLKITGWNLMDFMTQ
jgi:hypothetical protein